MKSKIICKILIFLHIMSIILANVYRNKFKNVCGQPKLTGRIIGGTNAESGEFPWMTRIGLNLGYKSPTFFCGGSLITDMHILSAEHCFYEVILFKETKLLVVSLGGIYGNDHYNSSSHAVIYKVSKLITYNLKDNFKDDISLLLLSKKVKFNDWILPVCLLHKISPRKLIGETAIVIGYGFINSKKKIIPDVLQKVTILIQPNKACRKTFESRLGRGQLCAGKIDKDSCNGDSGGPLIKLRTNYGRLRYEQLGVVSYGSKKCEDDSPGVYTNIRFYLKWIDSFLND